MYGTTKDDPNEKEPQLRFGDAGYEESDIFETGTIISDIDERYETEMDARHQEEAEHRSKRSEAHRYSNISNHYKNFQAGNGVGTFVMPWKGRHATYNDHLTIQRDTTYPIYFEPNKYSLFDGIIAKWLDDMNLHNGLKNPNDEFYAAYEPLRQNIAMTRSVIYTHFFPDGEYNPSDPRDAAKKEMLEKMGRALGSKLKWEAIGHRIVNFFRFNDAKDAHQQFGRFGVEHLGAAEMYKFLQEYQQRFTWDPTRWLQGKFTKADWHLPPIEQSPFRQEFMQKFHHQEYRTRQLGIDSPARQLVAKGMLMEDIAVQLKQAHTYSRNVPDMPEEKVTESVLLAHHILDSLKDMDFASDERIRENVNETREHLEEGYRTVQLAQTYQQLFMNLAKKDPSIVTEKVFIDAQMAIGKLGQYNLVHALEDSTPQEMPTVTAIIDNLPKEHAGISNIEAVEALRHIEKAINAIAKREKMPEQKPDRIRKIELDPNVQATIQRNYNAMNGYAARIGAVSSNQLVAMAQQLNEENSRASTQGQQAASANLSQPTTGQSTNVNRYANAHGDTAREDVEQGKEIMAKLEGDGYNFSHNRKQRQTNPQATPVLQK